MSNFKPKNYLHNMPIPQSYGNSDILREEFARVRSGKKLNAIDLKRYELATPQSSLSDDHNAWRKSINRAKTLLEYQNNRVINLELLSKYGSKVWSYHANKNSVQKDKTEKDVKNLYQECESVNRKRKAEQDSIKDTLDLQRAKYWEMIHKNRQLRAACDMFKNEIKRFKLNSE